MNASTNLRGAQTSTPLTKTGRPSTAADRRGDADGLAARLRRRLSTRPALNLALQGGGAHGAFTWGVLDALLEDPRTRFEGLSGSSAGAMNAVALASGWAAGGRDGARQALADFWSAIGEQMPFGLWVDGEGEDIGPSLPGKLIASWAAQFTPEQLNPLDLNPMRRLLEQQIDFERLRRASPFKLFVGTTHVGSGKLRVFREQQLHVDVLLASACLPKMHHAVEIDGETYWDGGYSANPAVFPLFYECVSNDILLVLLNPLARDETPRSIDSINSRIAELAFSSHFTREMRTFAQAVEFAASGGLRIGRLERRLQKTRFHMIDSSGVRPLQRSDTRLLAYGPFLEMLRDQGRERGKAWLGSAFGDVGKRSTIDVRALFG
ncbi:patatin-like phospholipase family protein [Piscinibacter sakaiensis]|uniref:patatin-like phospholipase family protein n=1 Tax=Piscinibacter sakaiensis TaxID=1547922 RepID=UPI003AAF6F8E